MAHQLNTHVDLPLEMPSINLIPPAGSRWHLQSNKEQGKTFLSLGNAYMIKPSHTGSEKSASKVIIELGICRELKVMDDTEIEISSEPPERAPADTALAPLFIPGKGPACPDFLEHRTTLMSLNKNIGTDNDEDGDDDEHWIDAQLEEDRDKKERLHWRCPSFGSKCAMIDIPGCHYGLNVSHWDALYKGSDQELIKPKDFVPLPTDIDKVMAQVNKVETTVLGAAAELRDLIAQLQGMQN